MVLAFVLTGLWQPGFNSIETARSFFGVHQVVETADGRHRCSTTAPPSTARSGSPTAMRAATPPEPLTYYYFGGPMSQTIEAVRAARGGLSRVAAVGLGTGSLACHRRGNEAWTFYEIDPEVVRIARDPRFFSFLSHCAPDAPDRARRCAAHARARSTSATT